MNHSILLHFWSASLSKSFLQLIVLIFIFSQYFFNRFYPVEKCRVIPYCLLWFINFNNLTVHHGSSLWFINFNNLTVHHGSWLWFINFNNLTVHHGSSLWFINFTNLTVHHGSSLWFINFNNLTEDKIHLSLNSHFLANYCAPICNNCPHLK